MNPVTLTASADGVDYSVSFDRFDSYDPRRAGYRWTVSETGYPANVLATGDDLRTGSTGEIDLAGALCSLLSFISHDADHHANGRAVTLFPVAMFDKLAGMGADDFASIGEEINPRG